MGYVVRDHDRRWVLEPVPDDRQSGVALVRGPPSPVRGVEGMPDQPPDGEGVGDHDLDALAPIRGRTSQKVDRSGAESRALGCLFLGDVRKRRQDGVRPGVGHLFTTGNVRHVVACRIDFGQRWRVLELFRHDPRRLCRSPERPVSDAAQRQMCETAAQVLGLPCTPRGQPSPVRLGLGMTRQVEQACASPRHAPHQTTMTGGSLSCRRQRRARGGTQEYRWLLAECPWSRVQVRPPMARWPQSGTCGDSGSAVSAASAAASCASAGFGADCPIALGAAVRLVVAAVRCSYRASRMARRPSILLIVGSPARA